MFGKHKHKWIIVKTIWPYQYGYGVYCPKCETIANTGLVKEDAEESLKHLIERG